MSRIIVHKKLLSKLSSKTIDHVVGSAIADELVLERIIFTDGSKLDIAGLGQDGLCVVSGYITSHGESCSVVVVH